MAATKIATCCYCGTKAALVLRGKQRHELACSNCGAPLRSLKMLPTSQTATAPAPSRLTPQRAHLHVHDRPVKRKKSKGLGRKMFSELWDKIEDVIDDVFD